MQGIAKGLFVLDWAERPGESARSVVLPPDTVVVLVGAGVFLQGDEVLKERGKEVDASQTNLGQLFLPPPYLLF